MTHRSGIGQCLTPRELQRIIKIAIPGVKFSNLLDSRCISAPFFWRFPSFRYVRIGLNEMLLFQELHVTQPSSRLVIVLTKVMCVFCMLFKLDHDVGPKVWGQIWQQINYWSYKYLHDFGITLSGLGVALNTSTSNCSRKSRNLQWPSWVNDIDRFSPASIKLIYTQQYSTFACQTHLFPC